MKPEKQKSISQLERASMRVTESIGSTTSIIIHTILFVAIFALYFFGVAFDSILLILTTAVSLEAIYLAIFIQMTVNRNTQSLEEVEEDIDAIQKDVDEIQEDVDEIQKDVDEIEKDVDEVQKDVDEIQEDVEEIEKDEEHAVKDEKTKAALEMIEQSLTKIISEIETMKQDNKK